MRTARQLLAVPFVFFGLGFFIVGLGLLALGELVGDYWARRLL